MTEGRRVKVVSRCGPAAKHCVGSGDSESIVACDAGPGVAAWGNWAMPAKGAASVEAVSGGA